MALLRKQDEYPVKLSNAPRKNISLQTWTLWIPFVHDREADDECGIPSGIMPRRKGTMLEIMEMERCTVRIINLRVVMMLIANGDPNLLTALTAMLDVLAEECNALL